MTEFSVFVGDVKKATVLANSTLEAVMVFRELYGYHHKDVWAMQAVVQP